LARGTCLLCAILLASCGGGDGYAVDLTIAADPSLPDGILASVKALEVAVSGAQTGGRSYPLDKPFANGWQ
jgi:hypothetical protein